MPNGSAKSKKPAKPHKGSKKTVKITVSATKISVVPLDVTINRLHGDTVEWVVTGAPAATIAFDDGTGPFATNPLTGALIESGPATAMAAGPYKYSVSANGLVLDPIIMVHPQVDSGG